VCHPRLGTMPQPGCTGAQALIIGSSGEAEGEEEGEAHWILVVTGLVQASLTSRTARISIGKRGRPQGPPASRTTTPPTSSTPSLAVPPSLPSIEADPSGSGTPSDLLSLCGNQVVRRFTRFAAPTGKSRVPESWDSMARPSR
jgi:hypothetical protein